MSSHQQRFGSEAVTEEWRPVPGCPAYEVSDRGRVRRSRGARGWAAGHILRPAAGRGGHLYVILADGSGKTRKHFVHRLVAMAFVGPPPFEGAFALHQDDDPANNTPDNLYWGTRQDNALDAKLNRKLRSGPLKHGGQPGEANGSAVLTEEEVVRIKGLLGLGLCGACISRLYGVRKETIYAIAKGRIWKHVTEEACRWIA
ncbi:MAG: NUMOD4 motif-containing HNH endonuclease [Geminicoccaceae bacterium]